MSSTSVAVVVTCHDLGRYLEEAVASVRCQTRAADTLLIVDDGSREIQTVQTLERLAIRGERILRLEGVGVAAARNAGAAEVAGDTLLFLDADDLLTDDHLERTAGRLEEEPELAFVTGGLEAFGEASYRWQPPPLEPLATLVAGGPHIATLLRRSMWEELGGFDPSFPAYEDTDFWVRALSAGYRGAVLPRTILRHRVRRRSRYHLAITGDRFAEASSSLLRKHLDLVAGRLPDFLRSRAAFREGLERHREDLLRRQGEHESALVGLYREREAATRALRRRGETPVEGGAILSKEPVSPVWGVDRGLPLDRVYVEAFLRRHRDDLRGRVLEVKDSGYTRMFGGERVERAEVVDVDPTRPGVTFVSDLTDAAELPDGSFDAFVLTQTLHLLSDPEAALRHAFRILRPGGVLLATLPAASRISYEDRGLDGDFWRFTEAGARELFARVFPPAGFTVEAHGNVRALVGFLLGLCPADVGEETFSVDDPWHPLLICVRAVRPHDIPAPTVLRRRQGDAAVVLAWHRIADPVVDPHRLCVGPERFAAQLAALRQRFRVMPLESLLEASARRRLPARAVALTFDDATVDHLRTAAPLLEALALPATFFAVPELLDAEGEAWWELLVRLLFATPSPPRDLPVTLEHGAALLSLEPGDSLETTFRTLHGALMDASVPERDRLLAEILDSFGAPPSVRDDHRPLRSAELVALARRPGMRIGNHTLHHLRLPLHPVEDQAEEVFGGALALEQLTGESCRTLAYPYGEADADTRRVAEAAGLLGALTVEAAPLRPGGDPFLTPRLEVGPWSSDELVARVEALLTD